MHEFVEKGDELRKRYGHAACVWDNMLVVVGGSRHYNKETRRRNCLNDVIVYNPQENKWTELDCSEGPLLEHRRYHTACMVGRHLVVYGGIDSMERYLLDLMVVSLGKAVGGKELQCRSFKWIKVGNRGDKPGRLAYHTAQLVLNPERLRVQGQFDMFALPELKGVRTKVETEGMYVFGGRDETGPRNSLYILKVNRRACEWILAKVAGQPPAPRYGHSMHYYPGNNVLVVFGGRNDANYEKAGTSYMNDVWVLELERLTWVRWDDSESPESPPEGRYSHCSEVLGNSVVVFGGLGEANYCRADVFMLDMEGMRRPRKVPLLESVKEKEETESKLKSPGSQEKISDGTSRAGGMYGSGESPVLFATESPVVLSMPVPQSERMMMMMKPEAGS